MRGELDSAATALFLFSTSFYIVDDGVHAVGELDYIGQGRYVIASFPIG